LPAGVPHRERSFVTAKEQAKPAKRLLSPLAVPAAIVAASFCFSSEPFIAARPDKEDKKREREGEGGGGEKVRSMSWEISAITARLELLNLRS